MIDYHAKIAQLTQQLANQGTTIGLLQNELEHTQAHLKEVQNRCAILDDAWEHQKTLTHNALVREREKFDELWGLRRRVAGAESEAMDWKRMYYGAIAKPPAVIE